MSGRSSTGAVSHRPAAVGLAVHTGWAQAVAVASRQSTLVVLHSQRIALWNPPDPAAAQAYHRAAELPLETAERAIAEDEKDGRRVAAQSLRRITGELGRQGYRLVAVRVVDRVRRPLPTLAKVLASHPLLHAAEGALFRRIALSEAGRLVDDVAEVDGADLLERAGKAAGLSSPRVSAHLARAGKISGTSWTKEHRNCALAAWAALLPHEAGS